MASVDTVVARFEQLSADGEYRPSALGHNEIRLLELFDQSHAKGSTVTVMRGRIFKASLDNVPEYRALSYTWGDMIIDQKLIVCEDPASNEEGTVLYITKQLQLALVRVQSQPQWKCLWIDQICINQKDSDERSSQVLLMKHIYQSSLQTIVWLGEPANPEDLPLISEMISFLDANELSEEQLLDGVPLMRAKNPVGFDTINDRKSEFQGFRDEQILKDKIDVSGTYLTTVKARRHKAVMNIFNQPYFRRAWVVQEIIVSHDVQVLYGDLEMPFKSLDRLGAAVLEIECEALGWYKALHNTTKGYGGFEYITRYRRNENLDGRSDEEFLQFLSGMQSCFESSDPRDKLYSFLGLKDGSAAPDMKPDYAKPVAEVFADCALSFIDKMKSLRIFCLVEGNDVWNCRCSFSIPNLPSWSPNWSQKLHSVCGMENANVKVAFRSARSRPHEGLKLKSLPTLSLLVRGKAMGTVKRVLSQNFDNRNSYFNGLQNLLQLDNILKELAIKDFRGDLRSVVLRTLLADGAWTKNQPMQFPISEVMALYNSSKGRDKPPSGRIDGQSDPLLLDMQMCALILQRKKFFEADGIGGLNFGLGNTYVRPGDMITILYGSNVPIVLRQTQTHLDPLQRRYKVICQCYLNEWMYGDSAFPDWWEEFETIPEPFVLI